MNNIHRSPPMEQPVCAVNESPAKEVLQEAGPLCQGKLEELQEEGSFKVDFSSGRWGRGSFQGVGEGREVETHTDFTGSKGTGEGRAAEGWNPGMMCGRQIMKCPWEARIKRLSFSERN